MTGPGPIAFRCFVGLLRRDGSAIGNGGVDDFDVSHGNDERMGPNGDDAGQGDSKKS